LGRRNRISLRIVCRTGGGRDQKKSQASLATVANLLECMYPTSRKECWATTRIALAVRRHHVSAFLYVTMCTGCLACDQSTSNIRAVKGGATETLADFSPDHRKLLTRNLFLSFSLSHSRTALTRFSSFASSLYLFPPSCEARIKQCQKSSDYIARTFELDFSSSHLSTCIQSFSRSTRVPNENLPAVRKRERRFRSEIKRKRREEPW
jgi:hypothetical protein